jgi:hypothetical protein
MAAAAIHVFSARLPSGKSIAKMQMAGTGPAKSTKTCARKDADERAISAARA